MKITKDTLKQQGNLLQSTINKSQYASTKEYFGSFLKWLKDWDERLSSSKVRAGIIGITSSGKSTLLNQILGYKVLPTGVPPTSGIQIVCQKGPKLRLEIFFKDSRPARIIDSISEIEARKILGDFGDEEKNPRNREKIEEISIYSPKFMFDEGMILEDTPGLDAYGHEEHQKITMNMVLPRVEMVIYLTTVKADSDQKNLEFIEMATDESKPLIIIQNKIDTISPLISKQASENKDVETIRKEHYTRVSKLLQKAAKKSVKEAPIVQLSSTKDQARWFAELKKVVIDQVARNHDSRCGQYQSQLQCEVSNVLNALELQKKDWKEQKQEQESQKRIIDCQKTLIESCKTELSTLNENLKGERQKAKQVLKQYLQFCLEEYSTGLNRILSTFSRVGFGSSNTEKSPSLEEVIKQVVKVEFSTDPKKEDFDFEPSTKLENIMNESSTLMRKTIEKLNSKMQEACAQLNLQPEQIVRRHSVDIKRFMVDKSVKDEEKSYRSKQAGFRGGTKRFFGCIFGNDDWGYETVYYTESIVQLKQYLRNLIKLFVDWDEFLSNNEQTFEKNVSFAIAKFEEQHQRNVADFELREKLTLKPEEVEAISCQFKKVSALNVETEISNVKTIIPACTTEEILCEREISPELKSIYDYAIHQSASLRQCYVEEIIKRSDCSGKVIIGSWDQSAGEYFACNFFAYRQETDLPVEFISLKPGNKELSLPKNGVLFLIINADQPGTTQKKLVHILDVLKRFQGEIVWVLDGVSGNKNELAQCYEQGIKLCDFIMGRQKGFEIMSTESDLYYSLLAHYLYFEVHQLKTATERGAAINEIKEVFKLDNEMNNLTGKTINYFWDLVQNNKEREWQQRQVS